MTHPVIATDPGVTRQVLAEEPPMTVAAFRLETGASGAQHSHLHAQSTYVAAGRSTFPLDGVEHALAQGESLVIGSGLTHGCLCHGAGTLIDTFTPAATTFCKEEPPC